MRWVKGLLYSAAGIMVFLLSVYVTMTVLITEESTVNTPDTRGKDLEEARRLVEEKGLTLVIARYEKRKDLAYNRIIAQKPEAHMAVRRGRVISVVVSEGPIPVTIPPLVGHALEYAETVLREKIIPLKKVIYVPHQNVGKIVAQVPRSGENIVDEDGMTLYVGAKRKSYFLMPDVAGTPVASIVDELLLKQIEHRITDVERSGGKAHTVIETSAAPKSLFNNEDVLEIKVVAGG